MSPEQRSRTLREEADEVLEKIRLEEHCKTIGEIIPTGSYYMDLMIYPDIDVYLPQTRPEILMGVAVELSKFDCIERINYLRGKPGDLKDGFYIKPVVNHGAWERPWKIDIWSLPDSVVQKKHNELNGLKSRMTKEHRAFILDFKFRLLTADGRTPMFSGIFIYRAVIDHGMTKLRAVVDYLERNGVSI